MKKHFLSSILMAMMAAMCVTFTACGGDDDDDPLVNDYSDVRVFCFSFST